MTAYTAIAILPDGTEAERFEFEFDPTTHESYGPGMLTGGIYLTLDAPGVADFCYRHIERGYLEAVAPLFDGDPLFVVDENGQAKGMGPNRVHPLPLRYGMLTAYPLLGTVIAVVESASITGEGEPI